MLGLPVALGKARFESYPRGDPVGIEVVRGVLEDLVVLDSELEPQARNLVRDLGELTEEVRVADRGPGVQVSQVVDVGYPGVLHLGLESRGRPVPVSERDERARVAGDPVVGHGFRLERARAPLGEKAELAAPAPRRAGSVSRGRRVAS